MTDSGDELGEQSPREITLREFQQLVKTNMLELPEEEFLDWLERYLDDVDMLPEVT